MKKTIITLLGAGLMFGGCQKSDSEGQYPPLMGDCTYTVSSEEIVRTDPQTGVSSLMDVNKYVISVFDDASLKVGETTLYLSKDASSFDGEYVQGTTPGDHVYAIGSTIKGESLSGDLVISQNILRSLSFTCSGREILTAAVGRGVQAPARPQNKSCTASFLTGSTSFDESLGVYVHSFSLGSKGVSVASMFGIDLYSGNGDYLVLQLLGKEEVLEAGTYKVGSKETGSILQGQWVENAAFGIRYIEGSQYNVIDSGGETFSRAVSGGEVEVSVVDLEKEIYSMEMLIILEDESYFQASYVGRLSDSESGGDEYEIDIRREEGLSCTVSAVEDGTGREGVLYSIDIQEDNGSIIAHLEIIPDEMMGMPYPAGTFTVIADPTKKYQAGVGYHLDLSFLGMGVVTGGCYFYDEGKLRLIPEGETFKMDLDLSSFSLSFEFEGTSKDASSDATFGTYISLSNVLIAL